MLAEMIDRIVRLSNAQHEFQELDLPGGREKLVRLPNGEIERIPVPPKRRSHCAGDLKSFVELVRAAAAAKPVVFVWFPEVIDHQSESITASQGGVFVQGILDFEDRRDSVSLGIPLSAAYRALDLLQTPQQQRTVVNALRDHLHDSVDSGLLPLFRALDFTRRSDGSRTMEHGRESLGMSVEAKVRSKYGDMPEQTVVELQLFGDSPFDGFRADVFVSIELDSASERIRLVPRGDDLHRAVRRGLDYVVDQISSEFGGDVLVVLGTP